jgi:hypothetical protein
MITVSSQVFEEKADGAEAEHHGFTNEDEVEASGRSEAFE